MVGRCAGGHAVVAGAQFAQPFFKHRTEDDRCGQIEFSFEQFFRVFEKIAEHFRTDQFFNCGKSSLGQGICNRVQDGANLYEGDCGIVLGRLQHFIPDLPEWSQLGY